MKVFTDKYFRRNIMHKRSGIFISGLCYFNIKKVHHKKEAIKIIFVYIRVYKTVFAQAIVPGNKWL